MKIALCSDWFYPSTGGVQSHIMGLSNQLTKKGHEVIIITKQPEHNAKDKILHKNQSFRVSNIKPMIPFTKVFIPPNISEFKDILKKEHFDVVHAHHAFTPTSLAAIMLATKENIPTVLTNHSLFYAYDSHSFWSPFGHSLLPFRNALNKIDKIISVSHAAAKFIEYFTDQENTLVIPNGVDIELFYPRKIIQNQINSTFFHKPSILYTGRLDYRKGLHVLLRSLPLILKKVPQAQLLVVGDGYMQHFLNLMKNYLNIQENVKFLGYLPNKTLPELYNLSDVFVFPSTSEAFGISLLEAMATEMPVVASNVGGISDIIEDGVNGILFKSGDERELAKAVLNMFSNPIRAKVFGKMARKKVEEIYSWPIVADKIEDVYKDIS
jgi:glycosyltransferase involved in cell wall biosynthesis